MNYLLVEIFLCLLLAGVIGLVIGWFLRGGCKQELLQNTNIWIEKMKKITTQHAIDLERREQEIGVLKNNSNLIKSNYKDMENRFINLKGKVQKYEIQLQEKKRKLDSLEKNIKSNEKD